MVRKSPLDEPENAAFAWRRFRVLMRILAGVTALTLLIFMAILFVFFPDAQIHLFIAVALSIVLTMLLGGGLMGLVFLSHGTGHDDAVDNTLPGASKKSRWRDEE
jgi:hypothetical protein